MFPPPPPESHLSLAERLALLSPGERTVALNALLNPTPDTDTLHITDPDTALQELLADAGFWLRPTQLQAIQDTAWIVVLLGGRGSGKTRTASHWVIEKAQTPGTRIHLVARTAADVRDVIIRGESGILNVSPPNFVPEYFPTLRRLTWPNGSQALAFSSQEPDALRGPQAHATLAEELPTWPPILDASGATAWDNCKISTRLGSNPQIMVTGTPRRSPQIKALLAQTGITKDDRTEEERDSEADAQPTEANGRITVHRTSTFDNRANLSPEYLTSLVEMYAGTTLERQELYGEMVDFVEGALFNENDLDPSNSTRLVTPTTAHTLTIIGVDPATGSTPNSATGIIVLRGTNPTIKPFSTDANTRSIHILDDLTVPGIDPDAGRPGLPKPAVCTPVPASTTLESWWPNPTRAV